MEENEKNFYGNFKTESDLRKEIGRLSYLSNSVVHHIMLINEIIGGLLNIVQKGKEITYQFQGDVNVVFTF